MGLMGCSLRLRIRKNGHTKHSPVGPSDVAAAAGDVPAVTVVVVCVGAVEQGRVVPGQEGPVICTSKLVIVVSCHFKPQSACLMHSPYLAMAPKVGEEE